MAESISKSQKYRFRDRINLRVSTPKSPEGDLVLADITITYLHKRAGWSVGNLSEPGFSR